MAVLYTNNASTTLSAGINSAVTSLSVASGAGALFPNPTAGDVFYATLANSAGNIEIVLVTARSADTFTIVRGIDGTTARAWLAGDSVEIRVTRAMLDDLKVDVRTVLLGLANTFTGAVTAPSFIPSGSSAPANGLFLPAANSVGIATGSVERVRVDGNGLTLATDVSGKVVMGRFSVSLTDAYFALGTGGAGYVWQDAGGATNLMRLSGAGVLAMQAGSLQERRVAIAASNIDLALGNWFTRTISGATTLTVSNTPAAGTTAAFVLDLTNGGSATVQWSFNGAVPKFAGGAAPTLTTSGRDVLGFFTHDGGTTWTGLLLGKDVR